MAAQRVHTIPIFDDNFAYILDGGDGTAACVDPADAKAVFKFAQSKGLTLTHILTTHSHWDHAGGNADMKKLVPGIEIIGGKGDGAAAVTREVWEGDSFKVGDVGVGVLATPCHTKGHVTFVCDFGSGPRCAFTGDTLFVAGCGNFNDGTPKQMYEALYSKIGELPDETLLYVGHEYTLSNLKFAAHAEPASSDEALLNRS
ncbi:beta-lactamase-like protein [Baffinella frigidus]|nr:beta-lactamase-like protein [Cryptophyta sp. CCMP2293]